MTTLREAAQQALEALEYYQHRRLEWDYSDEVAITALKAALAEPVQEPDDGGCDGSRGALCIHQDPNECKPERDCPAFSAPPQQRPTEPVQESAICDECSKSKHDGWALYCVKCVEPMFAPPQRKPLTEEDIWRTYKNLWMFHPAEEPRLAGDVLKFARAIERAHGIT